MIRIVRGRGPTVFLPRTIADWRRVEMCMQHFDEQRGDMITRFFLGDEEERSSKEAVESFKERSHASLEVRAAYGKWLEVTLAAHRGLV